MKWLIKYGVIICFIYFMMSFSGAVSAAPSDEISLYINGEKIEFSAEDGLGVPFIDKETNYTLVPIRKSLEAIGIDVGFEAPNTVIVSAYDATEIRMVLGEAIYLDGVLYSDYPENIYAKIIDNRAYMPIRLIFEILDYDVIWYDTFKTIRIDDKWRKERLNEEWRFSTSMAGMGFSSDIGITFNSIGYSSNREDNIIKLNEANYNLEFEDFSFSNRNDQVIVLKPLNITYKIYEVNGSTETEIYSYILPTLAGEFVPYEVASYGGFPTYWKDTEARPGTYLIKYEIPDIIYTYENETEEHHRSPEECVFYTQGLTHKVVIDDVW